MAIRWRDGHGTYKGWGPDAVETPRPTYDGAVLATGGSRTVSVMSDIWGTEYYATVWDGTKVTDVAVALHDDMGSRVYADATVDATPATRAAARAWLVGKLGDDWLAGWHKINDGKVADARSLTRGKEVTVVRGRKVPKGTTGVLFWTGTSNWGPRVGVKDAAGTVHWTAASNVEVTNPDDFMDVPDGLPTAADIAAHGELRVAALEAGTGGHFYPAFASWIIPAIKRAA